MVEYAQFRRAGLERLQHGQGVVAGAVVDADDLEGDAAAQGGEDLADQRGDVVAFVEYRDDDG